MEVAPPAKRPTPAVEEPRDPTVAPTPRPRRSPASRWLEVLERVRGQYRTDVNQLAPPAVPGAIDAIEGHLGRSLPDDLRRFLVLHNGAALFRNLLCVRSTSEIATASDEAPLVVLFADALGDRRWAFAPDPTGSEVWGLWTDERLDPVYSSFDAWFVAEVARIEGRVVKDEDLDALRREIAPDDPHQLVRAGGRALAAGRSDEALELLGAATRVAPHDPRAWQLLGDALALRDDSAARQAWLGALRRTRLPLPWPGAPAVSAAVLTALAPTGGHDERWEHELARFLTDQVHDVADADSLALVAAAAVELARSLVGRGRRAAARDVLAEVLERSSAFRHREPPWPVVLELARVEIGLGHHDAAEALLRKVRQRGPAALHGLAWLGIAEIATLRQEPWAEDALSDALAAGLDEAAKLQAALLRIERAVRQHRVEDAVRAADGLSRLARRVGAPQLDAAVALVLGDVSRLRGDLERAAASYARALELAGERDPEVRCRALLRQAELAWSQRRRDEALELAMRGAEGFRSLELPVRHAWALLRVARFLAEADPARAQQARSAARERFVAADLASGVAAVDSLDLSGSLPTGSLGWHLERASAHARARHDAQRARPPWDRADAERPERRLGAHRLAIGACGVAVVQALAREMEACARAASVGRGRPTDPPVLRYVAAVDLLSGHRSYEAARVLLDHLFGKSIDGGMLRALQGAIARSPNAALVDGLLRCVEKPTERPAGAVAAAAELLGLRREPVAVDPLARLLDPSSAPGPRKAAVTALGRIGERRVVDEVAVALDDPRTAEQAALALLMLGDRRGIDFHGRAMVEGRTDLSGSPGEIVGRYGGPDHLLLLVRAAEGEGERALGALQGLGLLGDPRGVPTLLAALHSRDRRMVEVACGALSILSGRFDDPTEPGVRARWHEWWEAAAGRLGGGVRHRLGHPFHCGLLIDAMEDPDPYVRRTAYDELVIISGQSLPFDADGPWRVQQAHLAAWRRWWADAAGRFPPGRWLLDGVSLGGTAVGLIEPHVPRDVSDASRSGIR